MMPDVEGLKTIARVIAFAQPAYVLANSPAQTPPIEDVEGHTSYHLALRPINNARKHNLRDLWIDVATHDLWKAHFVGTYAPVPGAPISRTDVTVYFRPVVGCWVVTRALWTYDDAPIHYDFDVQNNEIGLPGTLPDWLFDATEYRKHQLAGDPDYIGELLEAACDTRIDRRFNVALFSRLFARNLPRFSQGRNCLLERRRLMKRFIVSLAACAAVLAPCLCRTGGG